MPLPVNVTISVEFVTVKGLGSANAAVFKELVPSGRCESVKVKHDAKKLPPKEKKELMAFCAFARFPEFQDIIQRLVGSQPGKLLQLEIMSSTKNEDPPDLVLMVGGVRLPIEVTDFPPDQVAISEAIPGNGEISSLPTFHEGGCSPDLIKQFIETAASEVEPHTAELSSEIIALYDYARTTIAAKDANGKSELLLLAGLSAFLYPAGDVIDYVVQSTKFQSLRAVVFVLSDRIKVTWTNLA